MRTSTLALLFTGLLAVGFAGEAHAARAMALNRDFGIGVQLGFPTALTLKLKADVDQGVVIGLGGFGPTNSAFTSLSLHADYVIHPVSLVHNRSIELNFYLGVGGWALIASQVVPWYPIGLPYYRNANFAVLARVPFGLSMLFNGAPLELYAQITPALMVVPAFGFGGGGSLGIRLYF